MTEDIILEPKLAKANDPVCNSRHGLVVISPSTAAYNDIITVTVYPDEGYRLKNLSVVPLAALTPDTDKFTAVLQK